MLVSRTGHQRFSLFKAATRKRLLVSFLLDNSKTLLTVLRCIDVMRGGHLIGPPIHRKANRIERKIKTACPLYWGVERRVFVLTSATTSRQQLQTGLHCILPASSSCGCRTEWYIPAFLTCLTAAQHAQSEQRRDHNIFSLQHISHRPPPLFPPPKKKTLELNPNKPVGYWHILLTVSSLNLV